MLNSDHLGVLKGAEGSLVRVERRVDEDVGVLELRETEGQQVLQASRGKES